MITKLIEIYAGPGAGKSTLAAQLFTRYKTFSTYSVELVQEAAKEQAWLGHPICQSDVFFEQARRVDRLMGNVDIIITDSPLALSGYYGGAKWDELADSIYQSWLREQHTITKVFLSRTKPFDPRGRYQTEEQATQVCEALKTMHRFHHVGDATSIIEFLGEKK